MGGKTENVGNDSEADDITLMELSRRDRFYSEERARQRIAAAMVRRLNLVKQQKRERFYNYIPMIADRQARAKQLKMLEFQRQLELQHMA